MTHDLILRNGRIVDPASGRDEVADIAFAAGKVAAVGAAVGAEPGRAERDAAGLIVMPGMIDFHAHVYWGGTSISVDADWLGQTLRHDDMGGCRLGRAGQLRPVSAST